MENKMSDAAHQQRCAERRVNTHIKPPPYETRDGLVLMVVLGIVGAVVGGWVAGPKLLNIANVTGVNVTSIVVAVVGALIVIFVVDAFSGRRRMFGRRA